MDTESDRNPSQQERSARERLEALFASSPIPPADLLTNLGLYLNRQTLTRILFMDELYRKAVPVHGVVMEFGVRWGQNLALFESFRGMYEPYNHTRRVIGFDTFSGFPSVSAADGDAPLVREGAYGVGENYEHHLSDVLAYHEQESPLSHIRKYELVKGDVAETLPRYLEENPQTIVALAYFDLDLYEPTRACLEAIKDRLTKGSVIGFDELCAPDFPGETQALSEVLGLGSLRISRSPIGSYPSYAVVE